MKRFFTLLALCLLAVACNDASRDPVIKGYRIHQIGGLSFGLDGLTADVMLDLDIDNPSKSRYTIEDLHATVFPDNDTVRFADVYLKEKAVISPKSDATVSVPLDVRLRRPLALLGGGLSGELSKYEADIDLTIRKGSLKKNIRQKRVPLEKIADMLGHYMKTDTPESHEED